MFCVVIFVQQQPHPCLWLWCCHFQRCVFFRIFTFGTYWGKGEAIFRNMFLKAWNYYSTQDSSDHQDDMKPFLGSGIPMTKPLAL